MESSEVYRNAAAMMFEQEQRDNWGCCDVINYTVTGDPVPTPRTREHSLFKDYFKPTNPRDGTYWGNEWGRDGDSTHECRVLALCFMAAMCEASDA